MSEAFAGGCGCGAVRYRAGGKPLWVAHCHCRDCRRSTGSAFATYAGFAAEAFAWTGVAPKTHVSSPGVVRKFCGACGTPLTYESGRWAGEVHVHACTLDDADAVTPQAHVYAAEQIRWVRLADGLPRFAKTPKDGGPEA